MHVYLKECVLILLQNWSIFGTQSYSHNVDKARNTVTVYIFYVLY